MNKNAQKVFKGFSGSPNSADVYIDAVLTDISIDFAQDNDNFVGFNLVPRRSVAKQSGRYGVFARDDRWRADADTMRQVQRQEGTPVPMFGYKLSRDTYFCEQKALGTPITVEQVQNEENWVESLTTATQFVTEKLMVIREKEILDTIMPAAGNTNPWSTTITVNTKWDAAGSSPLTDVQNAKLAIKKSTGKMPNKAIIGIEAAYALLQNQEFINRISGGATIDNPALIEPSQIASFFGLEAIGIAGASENTAKPGADPVYAFAGNSNGFLLMHAPNTVGLRTPSAVTTFNWELFEGAGNEGIAIRQYVNEQNMSTEVQGFMAYDYKITSSDLGAYAAAAI